MESIDSISPPLEAATTVSMVGTTVGMTTCPVDPVKLPAKANMDGPLPSLPDVVI